MKLKIGKKERNRVQSINTVESAGLKTDFLKCKMRKANSKYRY